MTEIIPGILVHSLKESKEKNNLLRWSKNVHLDIMDGKFVPNKTIQALTVKKAIPKMNIQVHLMAVKPHKYVSTYARLGVKELIIHAESGKNTVETLEEIRLAGMKAGIAFNPETHVDKDLVRHADVALVMTVRPGHSGQKMLKQPLRKLAQIKKYNPVIRTGVDGGINFTTCRLLRDADFAIATHAVTDAVKPEQAYKELSKKCK